MQPLDKFIETNRHAIGAHCDIYSDTAIYDALQLAHQILTTFETQGKKHGYNKLYFIIAWTGAITANLYNSKKGFRIDFNQGTDVNRSSKIKKIKFKEPSYRMRTRKNGSYVRSLGSFTTLEKAIKATEGVETEPPKPKKPDVELKWHNATTPSETVTDKAVINNRHIHKAKLSGACHILPNGKIETKGIANPDITAYPYVKATDVRSRTLYFIMQNANDFMIALPRGSSTFITEETQLFTTGRNPLDITKDICKGDLELIQKAIRAGL